MEVKMPLCLSNRLYVLFGEATWLTIQQSFWSTGQTQRTSDTWCKSQGTLAVFFECQGVPAVGLILLNWSFILSCICHNRRLPVLWGKIQGNLCVVLPGGWWLCPRLCIADKPGKAREQTCSKMKLWACACSNGRSSCSVLMVFCKV
jgi:hypothetical protein